MATSNGRDDESDCFKAGTDGSRVDCPRANSLGVRVPFSGVAAWEDPESATGDGDGDNRHRSLPSCGLWFFGSKTLNTSKNVQENIGFIRPELRQ